MADNAIVAVAGGRDLQLESQLVEAARSYAEAGMAQSTRRTYGSSWKSFTSWCASAGVCPLPAEAAHVALYLTARAPTMAVSTLARHLAAIAAAHKAAGLPSPAHPDLDRVWAGIKRTHGRPPRKKRALVVEDLRRVVAKLPDTLIGKRDRAILLMGFASALRRSELANLSLEPAAFDGRRDGEVMVRANFVTDGLEILIYGAKGDQEGRGAIVAVPYGKKLCPVSSLQAWISAAGIQSGPIFRAVDRHGRLGQVAISDRAIALVVKAAARRAGLDPALFAGHSLRSGFITSASRAGAAPDVLQAHARHARWDTTNAYIQAGNRFQRNAAGKVGL